MADLDYAKVTGRFALVVGDTTADPDDDPDTVWCTSGRVLLTPLTTYVKVASGQPDPFTAGGAVIEASIDAQGYLTYQGKRYLYVVDLTSPKVNPQVPANTATHRVEFIDVMAGDTRVPFPTSTVRLTRDQTNDLTLALPVVPGEATPIYRGEQGAGVQSAAIQGGNLRLTLDDGEVLDAGPVPVGPGGSDAGVKSYLADDTSQTTSQLRQRVAADVANPASDIGKGLTATFVSYAPAPTGGDDQPMLQALIDQLAAGNGGVLLLRRGTYLQKKPLFIKNKVVVRGQGRSCTILKATSDFVGSFVIKLGADDNGFAFSSRLSNAAVNCNGVVPKGIYSNHGQEMTGASYCIVSEFTQYGMHFDIGVDNFDVDNIEFYPVAGGATAGFFGDTNLGANSLRRITSGVSGPMPNGVWLKSGSYSVTSVHAENVTNGVHFDGSQGFVSGVTGPTASSNVTNLVRISASTRSVLVASLTANGAVNLVRDDFNNVTIPATLNSQGSLPFYNAGDFQLGGFKMAPSGGDAVALGGLVLSVRAAGASVFEAGRTGDANRRWNIDTDGTQLWGPGSQSRDTLLYRNNANGLRTNRKMIADAGFGCGNSAVATTLGTVARKMEVFDVNGNSLGFVPIYNSIT